MGTLERITAALIKEQGVKRIDSAPDNDSSLTLPGFASILAKQHWGSVALVGMVAADGLGDAAIKQRAADFYELTRNLHNYAGVASIFTMYGNHTVKLGAFGVALFVFEAGCSDATAKLIKKQRRGGARAKEYALCWSVDVPHRRVTDHGWLPRTVFPSKRWLEGALR